MNALTQRQTIYLITVALGALILIWLLTRAMRGMIKERSREMREATDYYYEMSESLLNLSSLTPGRYVPAMIKALEAYLDLDEVSVSSAGQSDESLQRLLRSTYARVIEERVFLRINHEEEPLYVTGVMRNPKLRSFQTETVENMLNRLLKICNRHRGEVLKQQRTAALAITLQSQNTAWWRAIAGYQHDMDSIATVFFTALSQLVEIKGGLDRPENQEEAETLLTTLNNYQTPFREFARDVKSVMKGLIQEEPFRTYALNLAESFETMFRYWLAEQAELRQGQLEIVTEIPADISIQATEAGFFQAVWNPLKNAVKYTPQGQIKIYATDPDQGGWVYLVIEDTGVGISKEDLPYIGQFEFRSEKARDHYRGQGVGLWISNSIMDRMSGSFAIESELHRGTLVKLGFRKGEKP